MANTKDKILKAADDLFGKSGFDAASTREIAQIAGVNKALIHYHFENKEGLLNCLFDQYFDKLAQTLRKGFLEQGSLQKRMSSLVDAYMDFLCENRNFNRIVQREAAGGNHMDRVFSHTSPVFKLAMDMITSVYPATSSGEMSATQLLVSFYGMCITYFTYNKMIKQLTGTDPFSKENIKTRKAHLQKMVYIMVNAIENNQG